MAQDNCNGAPNVDQTGQWDNITSYSAMIHVFRLH